MNSISRFSFMTSTRRYLIFSLGSAIAIYLGAFAGFAVCFAAGADEQVPKGIERQGPASYHPSRFIPLNSLDVRKAPSWAIFRGR
jgi:hypothetical protein